MERGGPNELGLCETHMPSTSLAQPCEGRFSSVLTGPSAMHALRRGFVSSSLAGWAGRWGEGGGVPCAVKRCERGRGLGRDEGPCTLSSSSGSGEWRERTDIAESVVDPATRPTSERCEGSGASTSRPWGGCTGMNALLLNRAL